MEDRGSPPLLSSDFPSLPPSSSPPPSSTSPSAIFQKPMLAETPTASESTSSSSSNSLWKDLFLRNSSHKKHFPPPRRNADGIPVIKAPSSILLKTSEAWKDYLICYFFGSPPSLGKIYSDLNPIWGKQGSIKVQYYTPTACLILIPNLSIRNWVLDVGFWSAGTVSFAVSLWSPTSSLAQQALTSAPVWLSFQGLPPQLRSMDGLAVVASGVGTPLPPAANSKASVIGYNSSRIRAVVRLDKGPLPSTVIVEDDEGEQVSVGVNYLALPPLCPSCNAYGHRSHRCPLRSRTSSAIPSASNSLPEVLPKSPEISPNSSVVLPVSVHGGDKGLPSLPDASLGFATISGPISPDPAIAHPSPLPIKPIRVDQSHQPLSPPAKPSVHKKFPIAMPHIQPTPLLKPTSRPSLLKNPSPNPQSSCLLPSGPSPNPLHPAQPSVPHSAQLLPNSLPHQLQRVSSSDSQSSGQSSPVPSPALSPSSTHHPISPHMLPHTPLPLSNFTSLLLSQIEDKDSLALASSSISEDLEEGEFTKEALTDPVEDAVSQSIDDSPPPLQNQLKKHSKKSKKKKSKDRSKDFNKQVLPFPISKRLH